MGYTCCHNANYSTISTNTHYSTHLSCVVCANTAHVPLVLVGKDVVDYFFSGYPIGDQSEGNERKKEMKEKFTCKRVLI